MKIIRQLLFGNSNFHKNGFVAAITNHLFYGWGLYFIGCIKQNNNQGVLMHYSDEGS